MTYPISDIYQSIQGEGVNVGIPMIFLRLQGCLVGCAFCLHGSVDVHLSDGSRKKVKEVSLGDRLLCYDETLAVLSETVVMGIQCREVEPEGFWRVVTDDLNNHNVTCTPDHEFFTSRGWVRADSLIVGEDVVYNVYNVSDFDFVNWRMRNANPMKDFSVVGRVVRSGPLPKKAYHVVKKDHRVFDLSCSPHHNFFANTLLVHNCDTKETWSLDSANHRLTIREALGKNPLFSTQLARHVAEYIQELFPVLEWVEITGGEPADYDLSHLVRELHTQGKKVSIETSGTALGHLRSRADWIVVSPKTHSPFKAFLDESLMGADEIKYVVGKEQDVLDLKTLLDRASAAEVLSQETVICLQPMSQSRKATDLCIQAVQENGWRLSAQLHKYLGLP